MNPYLRLALAYSVFLIVVGAAQFAYNLYAPAHWLHPMAWVIFAFVTVMTAGMHFFLLRAAGKDAKVFIRGFMAANTLKLLIYLAFMVLYVFSVEKNREQFIAHFFAYYLIFTVFEITSLYRYLLPKR